jgi:hypothetical protein
MSRTAILTLIDAFSGFSDYSRMSVIRPEAIPEPWDLAFYSSEEPVVGPVGPSLLGSVRCEVRMA